MEKIVEELKYGIGRRLKVTVRDDNNRIIEKRYIVFKMKIITINEFDYILLYNNEMEILEDVYKYINIKLKNKSFNTRVLYTRILKQLYEFSYVIGKSIDQLNYNDFFDFQDFLFGYKNASILCNYYFYSQKSKKDVNKYLNVVKSFLKTNRFNNYKLIEKTIENDRSINHSIIKNCPKYISKDQMIALINLVRNDKIDDETKLKFECIYRLLYEAGLRIGEVLGLTLEDFQIIQDKSNNDICVVKIRNRLTDNKDQSAKTCMNITNQKQYHSKEYLTHGPGYQKVIISVKLYEDIIRYFDMACNRLIKFDKTPPVADSVEKQNNDNYYIFINSTKNTPLNIRIITMYTKEKFNQLSIPVDENKRMNNLFHRFRHGFAMMLLYDKKLSEAETIRYTRHSSSVGLSHYNNPTDETLTKHLEEIEKEYLREKDNERKNNN